MNEPNRYAYVMQGPGKPGLFVTETDYRTLERKGHAALPDLVRVPSEYVVLEIDQRQMKAKPIGISKYPHKVDIVRRSARRRGKAIRPDDIVDIPTICRRTNRNKASVSGIWKKQPDWPEPVMKLGRSEGYYWPEVVAFLQRHNLRVKRQVEWRTHAPEGNQVPGHTDIEEAG